MIKFVIPSFPFVESVKMIDDNGNDIAVSLRIASINIDPITPANPVSVNVEVQGELEVEALPKDVSISVVQPDVQLTEPDGWFLMRAAHEHTKITYATDLHEPLSPYGNSWVVEFQMFTGGNLTCGYGCTLAEAWENALEAVRAYHD